MRILSLLLSFLLFFPPYSISGGDEETPEDVLKKQMKFYQDEYPSYLKEKYKLALSEYFWKRAQDLKTLSTAINLRLAQMDAEIEDAQASFNRYLFQSNETPVQSITILRSISNTLVQKIDELESYQQSLQQLSVSIDKECNEKDLISKANEFDPRYIFPVPQYAFTAGEAPKINMQIYFQVNYNTDGGQFGYNTEVDGEQMTEEQEAVVYIGAAIITGLIIAGTGWGATAGAAIFAGSVQVMKLLTAFSMGSAAQDEYKKQMEKVIKMYDELNNDIYTVHDELAQNSSQMIQDYCSSSISKMNNDERIFVQNINKSIVLVTNKEKLVNQTYQDMKNIVTEEENKIFGQVQSDLDFLNQNQSIISTKYRESTDLLFAYEQELDQKAMNYFVTKSAVSIEKINFYEKSLLKVNEAYSMWDDLIVGDAKFNATNGPKSINWEVFRKQSLQVIEGVL